VAGGIGKQPFCCIGASARNEYRCQRGGISRVCYRNWKAVDNMFMLFDEKYNDKSSNEPTGNARENYIRILSTMYKIILDFAEKEKPKYMGISSLDKSGYRNIYNNLSKTNFIPNYTKKDAGLEFTNREGDKGKFIVFKKIEE
jgi:hypothetical protein